MKNKLRQQLSTLGVLPKIDFLRWMPETVRWVSQGCTGMAPHPIKRLILASYIKRYRLNRFIETGTHVGDTLAYIANNKKIACISIELSDDYYSAAKHRFRGSPNVTLMHGDSGEVLPRYVRKLNEPSFFWLDGHYSGGNTGRGKLDTPVSAELEAILNSSEKRHVILIDDARLFDGTNAYPRLDELLEKLRINGTYNVEVSVDIIRLTPKDS
jgi:hypothetical protein